MGNFLKRGALTVGIGTADGSLTIRHGATGLH